MGIRSSSISTCEQDTAIVLPFGRAENAMPRPRSRRLTKHEHNGASQVNLVFGRQRWRGRDRYQNMTRDRGARLLAGVAALGFLGTAVLHSTGYQSIVHVAKDVPGTLGQIMPSLWLVFSIDLTVLGVVVGFIWRLPAETIADARRHQELRTRGSVSRGHRWV